MRLKLVLNKKHGGFGLSDKAIELYNSRTTGKKLYLNREAYSPSATDKIWDSQLERHDPVLVNVVEELGEEANGEYAKLQVVEVELGVNIREYDGMESIDGGYCHEVWRR